MIAGDYLEEIQFQIMKRIIFYALLCCARKSFSQDKQKLIQIDSMVIAINKSDLRSQNDSIFKNYPELGMDMKTYLTTILAGNELKKFVNKVHITMQENGASVQSLSSNTFYFDKSQLIKVEEFMIKNGKEMHADWYYADDKPLYYTLESDKSEERATLLLTMSKAMLKQIREKL